MIRTEIVDFHNYAKSVVACDENGDYTIFLNARFNMETLTLSYEHEMDHIKNNDFEKTDVDKIELMAHKLKN